MTRAIAKCNCRMLSRGPCSLCAAISSAWKWRNHECQASCLTPMCRAGRSICGLCTSVRGSMEEVPPSRWGQLTAAVGGEGGQSAEQRSRPSRLTRPVEVEGQGEPVMDQHHTSCPDWAVCLGRKSVCEPLISCAMQDDGRRARGRWCGRRCD